MNLILDKLQRFAILASSRNDLVLAVILVGIIFMMILPLPVSCCCCCWAKSEEPLFRPVADGNCCCC